MKKRQVQRAVERHVAPRFPGLQPIGDLLVARSGPVLRGFAFEQSQMDRATFRLHAFGQLLSVPSPAVTFGLSEVLGNFRADGDVEEAFKSAADQADTRGRDFLGRLEDCRSMLENHDSLTSPTTDGRLTAEIRAHLLAHLGRTEEAMRALGDVANALTPLEVEYEEAALKRVSELRRALERSPEQGQALLEEWTQHTAGALGLDSVRA